MIFNDDLGRMGMELVVALVPQHLLQGTEENTATSVMITSTLASNHRALKFTNMKHER
jgi:hypothetical protein